jgi:hypothetical protein
MTSPGKHGDRVARRAQERRVKLYLSGPMTGLPEFNYPAFHAAKRELQAFGYDVCSPADLPLRDDWEWIDYILIDVDSVFASEGIATLDGCDTSKGARIERRIAERLGLPIKPVGEWLL